MTTRGWTGQQIDDAVQNGSRIDAVNRATGNPATRYVSPANGKSVTIDNLTGEIIQVGGSGFQYGPNSGDVPDAQMRSPTGVPQPEPTPVPTPPVAVPEPVPAAPELPKIPLIEPFL